MTRAVPPLAALALLALAACEPMAPGATPGAPVQDGACDAPALAAAYVGRDASALLATTFTIPVRFLRPGDVVTLDYQPGRANFEIDAAEVVARVTCG